MKKYTYLITFLLIILSCKKEKPIDIIKENELDEFSKHIFDQKIIDSKEILRLIESKTVTKFKDKLITTEHQKPLFLLSTLSKLTFKYL